MQDRSVCQICSLFSKDNFNSPPKYSTYKYTHKCSVNSVSFIFNSYSQYMTGGINSKCRSSVI